jgi:PST family polysaccharide transporter
MSHVSDQIEFPSSGPVLRTDTLADSVLILVLLTGIQRLVGFCRAVLFCRWLDAEQLGQWDMAFGFLVLAAPLTILALPGAFGRYVERYRQQGQLRVLLRRTLVACAALTAVATVLICLGRGWVSLIVFGTSGHGDLVLMLAAALAAVIAFNYMVELFTALRNVRLVSALLFLNSAVFAVLGVGLLLAWRDTAASVVLAYGGANLLSAAAAVVFLRRAWRALPTGAERLSHRALWSKLMPFALWVWTTNLMANLFEVADRYMIVHFSRGGPDEALALVGQYHSSRVVPVLLFSVALMLGSMLTPHLSADWEAGRRREVAARLKLFLKLLAFGLTAAGAGVLLIAPLLFGVAFENKFAAGRAVLPWTLTYCTWFGLAMVAQNYLWCAEKARLSSLALGVGLVVNVALNLLLLPRLGLLGAVLATAAANLIALAMILAFDCRLGFRMDRGLWVVLGMVPVVCLGPWIALLVLAIVALEGLASDRLLDAGERQIVIRGCEQYLHRLPWFGNRWGSPKRAEDVS